MRIDLGVGIIGEGKPELPKMKDPTRREIADRIAEIDLDDSIRFKILQKLAGYPDGALHHFRANLRNMINNLRKKDNEERNYGKGKGSTKDREEEVKGEEGTSFEVSGGSV